MFVTSLIASTLRNHSGPWSYLMGLIICGRFQKDVRKDYLTMYRKLWIEWKIRFPDHQHDHCCSYARLMQQQPATIMISWRLWSLDISLHPQDPLSYHHCVSSDIAEQVSKALGYGWFQFLRSILVLSPYFLMLEVCLLSKVWFIVKQWFLFTAFLFHVKLNNQFLRNFCSNARGTT